MSMNAKVKVAVELMAVVLLLVGLFFWGVQYTGKGAGGDLPVDTPLGAWIASSLVKTSPTTTTTPIDNGLWKKYSVTTGTGSLIIEHPTTYPKSDDIFPFVQKRLGAKETLFDDGGTVRFRGVALGWRNAGQSASDPVVFQAHGPDLLPLSPTELVNGVEALEDLGPPQEFSMFPEIRFLLEIDGWEDATVFRTRACETQSRRSTILNAFDRATDTLHLISTQITSWRPAATDVTFDIAHGPAIVGEFDLTPGAGCGVGPFDVRLGAVLKGVEEHGAFTHSMHSAYEPMEYKLAPKGKGVTRVYLTKQPGVWPTPLKIELLDAAGQVLPSGSSMNGSDWHAKVKEMDGIPKRARVSYPPKIHRVTFQLDSIPVLPAANKAVTNLLDVRAPALFFEHKRDMEIYLYHILGLTETRRRHRWGSGSGPAIKMRDASISDVIKRYRDISGASVDVDPASGQIVFDGAGALGAVEDILHAIF